MKLSLVAKDILGNLSLKRAVNRAARSLRKSALNMLPSKPLEDAAEVLYTDTGPNRWTQNVAAALDAIPADSHDRLAEAPRTAFVRKYAGDLRIDPYSTHIFDGRKIVWGSTDGLSREREPTWASQIHFPRAKAPALLSLRGGNEYNYFHFFYDTLRALELAGKYVDPSIPALVGTRLARNRFFKDAVGRGAFGSRPVIIQGEGEMAAAQTIYTVCAPHADRKDMMGLCERLNAPKPSERPGRRIYLSRGKKAQNKRTIRNEAELVEALRPLGFESVDTQEYGLEEQMALFAETELVVAPHGAGLTNVIWRQGRPMRVIELVNTNYYSVDFQYFCHLMGYRHMFLPNHGVMGRPLKSSALADIPAIVRALDA